MIINRRFIFALVLLCQARTVHPQSRELTPADIEEKRSKLRDLIRDEGCDAPKCANCRRLYDELDELDGDDYGMPGDVFVNYDQFPF